VVVFVRDLARNVAFSAWSSDLVDVKDVLLGNSKYSVRVIGLVSFLLHSHVSNLCLKYCNMIKSGGQFTLASPHFKFWGTRPTYSPVIYALAGYFTAFLLNFYYSSLYSFMKVLFSTQQLNFIVTYLMLKPELLNKGYIYTSYRPKHARKSIQIKIHIKVQALISRWEIANVNLFTTISHT